MFIRLSLFQKIFKLIGIGLIKQQKLDADPTAIQQINFTGDQDRVEGFSLSKKRKKQFQIFQNERLQYYDFILF